MIRIALDITCKRSIAKSLQFKSVNSEILGIKSRRIPPSIWRYQSLELKTMIGNFRPDQLDMSTSVLRWIVRDLVKNTKFLYQTIIRTYRFEVAVSDVHGLPLEIFSPENNIKTWVSRHSLWAGIKPTDLEGTLEEDRLKNPLQFGAMVRSANVISDLDAFTYDMHEKNSYSLQSIDQNYLGGNKYSVEAETVANAEIFHARAVVANNQILQMSNRRTPLMPRSPGFIDEFNGKYRAFNLFYPQLEIENGLYVGTATNWFHFIVELAVRIAAVPKETYFGRPIIIEVGAHENILRLCRLMTGVDPIQVAVGQSIRVSSLTVLREFGVQDPIDPVQRTKELRDFADLISNEVESKPQNKLSRLFFRRPSHLYRPLQNEKQVADFLESKGFVSVYPERFKLDEFISLLKGADFVVAESGAAITNMMFAKQKTKFLELTPALVTPEFWRTFIEVFDQNYSGIHGKVARIGAKGYAFDGYKIPIDELRDVLSNWGTK